MQSRAPQALPPRRAAPGIRCSAAKPVPTAFAAAACATPLRTALPHVIPPTLPRTIPSPPSGVFHRPLSWCGAGRRLPFPSPSHEGAERRNGAGNVGHLNEGAHLPRYRQARPPALHRSDFCRGHRTSSSGPEGLPLTLSRQQSALPFIRSRPAIEGSPLIGCGRWPRLLGRGYEPRLQAPHRAPPNRRL
jgi:hypothetical protein